MESKVYGYLKSRLNLTSPQPAEIPNPSHVNGKTQMQVLVLGMCRTGTISMYDALQQLGYKPYHMVEAHASPKRDFNLWIEALNAKYNGVGKPWGRAEFDNIFRDHTAVLDAPSALFAKELIAAYPETKVILTLRDPDSWITSMNKTIFYLHKWPLWNLMVPFNASWIGPWYLMSEIMWDGWLGERRRDYCSKEYDRLARQKFLEHYELVRTIVPKERLLEFSPSMGWGPLCDFLKKEKIEGTYPRSNDANFFLFAVGMLWVFGIANVLGKTVLPVVSVAFAAIYLHKNV